MPPPAAAISSYDWPCARRSNSSTREPAQTACVWQSTRPGMALMPVASITVAASTGSIARSTSSRGPTATIRPAWAAIAALRWTTSGVATVARRSITRSASCIGRVCPSHADGRLRPVFYAAPREGQRADRKVPALLLVRVLPAAGRRRRGAAARDDAHAALARPGVRVGHLRRRRLHPRAHRRHGRPAPGGGGDRADGAVLLLRLDPRGAAGRARAHALRRLPLRARAA